MIVNWIRHKKSDISVSFEGRLSYFNYFGLKQNLSNPLVTVKTTTTKQSKALNNFFGQDISTYDPESWYAYFISKILYKVTSKICS